MNETKVDEIKFKEEVDSSYFPPTYHQYYNFCKPPFKVVKTKQTKNFFLVWNRGFLNVNSFLNLQLK
jgi:hypothetical protein